MVPALDQSMQVVVDAMRMRGWKIDIACLNETYCVVAWQAGGPSRTAAGPNLFAALQAVAEKVGLQADDY